MRSGRNIIATTIAGVAAGWFATGLVIDALRPMANGMRPSLRMEVSESSMLLSAIVWMVVLYVAALGIVRRMASDGTGMFQSLVGMGRDLRDSIIGDDDEDDHDDVIDDDREVEPLHPAHWLGARVAALAAVMITFMVCEGLDMVGSAHARPVVTEAASPAARAPTSLGF